jgi:hypothetical protein
MRGIGILACGTIIVGNDLGLFRSRDDGDVFEEIAGPSGDPLRPERFVVVGNTVLANVPDYYANHIRIFASGDEGATWTEVFGTDESVFLGNAIGTETDNLIATSAGLYRYVPAP